MIYFIGSLEHEYVKIGYTDNIVRRLQKMQSDSPFKLIVFRQIEGDQKLEKLIHKRFQYLHIRGEWFLKNKELFSETSFDVDGMELAISEIILTHKQFPTKEVVKTFYPNINWSKYKKYNDFIKKLCLAQFGCVNYPTYLKLKELYALELEGVKEVRACKILNISSANYYTLKNKYKIFKQNM
jgi:hypothetical protein